MSDMLDFSAAFWEDLLDCESPTVDNKGRNGELTYAATDYLGVYPVSMRLPELGKAKADWLRYSAANRKARTKSVKHHAIKNR